MNMNINIIEIKLNWIFLILLLLKEAYKKLKQAEKIKKSHPSVAANVYWNAATGILLNNNNNKNKNKNKK